MKHRELNLTRLNFHATCLRNIDLLSDANLSYFYATATLSLFSLKELI